MLFEMIIQNSACFHDVHIMKFGFLSGIGSIAIFQIIVDSYFPSELPSFVIWSHLVLPSPATVIAACGATVPITDIAHVGLWCKFILGCGVRIYCAQGFDRICSGALHPLLQ
jgi:hypothetical protein